MDYARVMKWREVSTQCGFSSQKKAVGYNNIMCRSRQGLLGENVPRFIRTIVLCAKLLLNIIESMILFTRLSRQHDYIPDDLILHLHTMMYVVRITKIATSKMS